MTRADNTHHLLRAAAQRHNRAINRARAAIDTLDRSTQAVTFSAVAHATGVSRGWLYRQDELRRHNRPAAQSRHPSTYRPGRSAGPHCLAPPTPRQSERRDRRSTRRQRRPPRPTRPTTR